MLRPALQRLPLPLQSQELFKINDTLVQVSYGYTASISIRTDELKAYLWKKLLGMPWSSA